MDESDFKGHLTGEVRWGMNGAYCYFQPHDLPFDWECSRATMALESAAARELARLDGMLRSAGEDVFSMLVMNISLMESASSSSIEGTRSTVDDVLRSEKEAPSDSERIEDNREIANYRRALLYGFDNVPVGGRLTVDLVKTLHRILMEGARGSDKIPGEFKTRQNAIGRATDTLETAKMVPAPPEAVDHLLDNWLEYVNSARFDTVEKAAVAHYQFECIHPFRDGNGRVGRLLLLLVLRRDGLLRYPVLFLSGYLDLRRDRYIDLMYGVSSRDALDEWVGFMSKGLEEQAMSTAAIAESLTGYRRELLSRAADANDIRAIEMLFANPYVTSKDLVSGLGVSPPTANKILKRFEAAGILREVSGRERNRLYLAEDIMRILRRGRSTKPRSSPFLHVTYYIQKLDASSNRGFSWTSSYSRSFR